MRKKEIKTMRMNLGKFLHTYYVKFGEEKYDKFIEEMGTSMVRDYGEPFSSENLRIMEAEYVMFNTKINGKDKENTSK